MNLSRRNFLATTGAGSLASLVTAHQSHAQATPADGPYTELKNGERWLRLVQENGKVEVRAGIGPETTAILREPLGVCWYQNDGNMPDGERRAAWQRAETSAKGDALWTLTGQVSDPKGGTWEAATQVKKDGEGFRLITQFTRRGAPRAASVRVHTRFTAPPVKSYTLIPGAVYNGNRADAIVPRNYCPLLTNYEVQTREAGTGRRVVADIPRQDASTWWTVHLWGHQSASASVSAFNSQTKGGVHLGYARTEGGRVLGVIHTTDPQTNFHQVTIENPCVRSRRFRNCTWVTAPDRPHRFADGESAVVELRLMPVTSPDVPTFVSSWTAERALRRQGKAPGQNGTLPQTPDVMPRSHASTLAIDWNDNHLWNEKGYYKTIHAGESHPRELILGWGSGTMTLWAMFRLGTPQMKERVRRTTQFIIENAQAPGGLFYGVKMRDGRWVTADGDLDYFWAMNALTPRRTTDTVYYGFYLADALRTENGTGDKELAARLDKSLLKACDALARVWKKEGNIPFLLDPHTERTVWAGAFGGARAISCLVLAAGRFNRPDLLQTAKAIAEKYVADGIARGETWGGPTDVMQGTTDNESITALTEGLTLLHGATKDPQHLKWASQAADLLATWVLDEPIEFPKDSVLGSNNIQPFGALIASTQNAWGTPGMCVNSGVFLLDLYERTGQGRYMDMLSDIVRLPMQMMVRPGQKWGSLEPGQMTECASFNDVPGEFGHAYTGSATWPVNAMLVGEVELPSIYMDNQQLWRLDHLTAKLDDKGVVTVGNPTEFPATARLRWRNGTTANLTLKPGETTTYAPSALGSRGK